MYDYVFLKKIKSILIFFKNFGIIFMLILIKLILLTLLNIYTMNLLNW